MTNSRPVDVDQVAARFLDSPDAQRAYHYDPTYHHDIDLLRATLRAVDRAMREEDIPHDARQRVIRAVLHGTGPDEREAWQRVGDHEDRAALLAAAPPAAEARDLYALLGVPGSPFEEEVGRG